MFTDLMQPEKDIGQAEDRVIRDSLTAGTEAQDQRIGGEANALSDLLAASQSSHQPFVQVTTGSVSESRNARHEEIELGHAVVDETSAPSSTLIPIEKNTYVTFASNTIDYTSSASQSLQQHDQPLYQNDFSFLEYGEPTTEIVIDTSLGLVDFMLDSEQEMVFLLRHYVETIAPWYASSLIQTFLNFSGLISIRLDLFDERKFFQTCVSAIVATNRVLKYATAAVAAKHLSRIGGVRPKETRGERTFAMTESYPDSSSTDWSYKAANYYYQAIGNLQQATPHGSKSTTPKSANELSMSAHERTLLKRQCLCCKEDGLITFSTLLTVYDMLDSQGSEWTQSVQLRPSTYLDEISDSLVAGI
jgi:hypothetical protein